MSDRSFQTSIAAMIIAMVGIVAGAWTLHLVTPQQVAPAAHSQSV